MSKNLTLLFTLLALASCGSQKKTAPVKSVEISMSEVEQVEPQVIYFDADSAKLDRAAISILNYEVFPEARNRETIRVNIEGRCDGSSSSVLNAKRVKAIKLYLVTNGAKVAKMRTIACSKTNVADLDKSRGAVIITFKK